ncbi:MAG: ATP-dependent DNA ligase [Acidimicrobiia bacterium]
MLLASVVEVSDEVAATSKRLEKRRALAGLLRRLAPEEIEPVVGFLTGTPRQGRIGVGWATVGSIASAREGADVPGEASIEVMELDDAISMLSATSGSGSVSSRQAQLEALFGRATAAERSFMWRLLTGELRQGALAGVMADAVASAAGVPVAEVRRAAMLGGDLGRAARVALEQGTDGLASIGLTVLHPVQPMLAASATGVAEALALTGPASVEWKLDGARIQVHRKGDEVRIYTRNLNDVTDRLPLVAAAVRSLDVTEIVLDGEALGLDDDGRPRIFQDTMSRFGTEEVAHPGGHLQPYFFDVLRLDGKDLIDATLRERIDVLDAVAGPWRIPKLLDPDADRAAVFLDEAIDAGHEGVMVKALDSTYDAGRRGAAWRKVKPVRTLDLVVLAAEWGHGRRTGWLSNLHLGARDPNGGFVMVGKTFKGLTDSLLQWQTDELQAREVRSDGHVVHVRPDLVVEIALDGVQVSRRYPGGVALRFARVKGYRPDKAPDSADVIETVQAMLPGGRATRREA